MFKNFFTNLKLGVDKPPIVWYNNDSEREVTKMYVVVTWKYKDMTTTARLTLRELDFLRINPLVEIISVKKIENIW